MKRFVFLAFCATATLSQAQVSSINSAFLMTRYYNDVPNSALSATNVWNEVTVHDVLSSAGGANGWANRHDWALSNDGGASAYAFDGTEDWSFDFDLLLSASGSPGFEAGIMIDNVGNGNHHFLVKDGNAGETVAFGGGLPFYSFTGSNGFHWTPGTPVHMGMDYDFDGTSAKARFRLNDMASPWLAWGNIEGKLLPGSRVGGYALFQNGPNSETDFGDVKFQNIHIVPEPATMAVLGIGAAALLRRRRK